MISGKMNHNCPFLTFDKWCDFKRPETRKRVLCIYSNPEKCPHYESSKTKLKVDSKRLKTPKKCIIDETRDDKRGIWIRKFKNRNI